MVKFDHGHKGRAQVSLSSELMPMVKAVPRGLTACADAYLTPAITRRSFALYYIIIIYNI